MAFEVSQHLPRGGVLSPGEGAASQMPPKEEVPGPSKEQQAGGTYKASRALGMNITSHLNLERYQRSLTAAAPGTRASNFKTFILH